MYFVLLYSIFPFLSTAAALPARRRLAKSFILWYNGQVRGKNVRTAADWGHHLLSRY